MLVIPQTNHGDEGNAEKAQPPLVVESHPETHYDGGQRLGDHPEARACGLRDFHFKDSYYLRLIDHVKIIHITINHIFIIVIYPLYLFIKDFISKIQVIYD